MSRVQFNQVFAGLMILSLVSAFALPPRVTDIGRTPFQTLLIPISRPTYRLANSIRGRFETRPVQESRANDAIEAENQALRAQVQQLQNSIDLLQERAHERANLGGFDTFCDRFEVSAADTNGHEGITIAGTKIGDLREQQPVLSSGGVIDLIGQVTAIRGMAAHVRLLTDAGFTLTGRFVSFSASSGAVENANLLAIVTGGGLGRMSIQNLHADEVKNAGIQPGDWVVLHDETWPRGVQRMRIGQVASVKPLAKQPLFADIELVPEADLTHLNDVWVMTRQPE